jgi:brefeldin A-resistance guanine nucleotide exchange factor 1
MLNTDLHNPQIRVSPLVNVFTCIMLTQSQKRMTIEEYRRNLRGVNDGTDFSPEYLVRVVS